MQSIANEKLGKLILPFGLSKRTIYAGPYRNRPSNMFGVKLASEIDAKFDISVPIRDFSIPDRYSTITKAAETVLELLAFNRKVFCGCAGGRGRTGLFLTLLAQSLGVSDPIGYVRANYNPHAVETDEQKAFLGKIPMESLIRVGRVAKWEAGTADVLGFFGLKVGD